MRYYICGFLPFFLLGIPFWGELSEILPSFETDLAMGVGLSGLVALALSRFIDSYRRPVLVIWGFYSGVALGGSAFYEVAYMADGLTFFSQAAVVQSFSLSPAFLQGNQNFVQLLGLLRSTWVFDSYFSLKIVFSLFTLAGSLLIFQCLNSKNLGSLLFVSLFPSVVFWGTFLSKDAVVFCMVSLFIFGFIKNNNASALFSLLGLAYFRLWMVPILIIPLIIFHQNSKVRFVSATALASVLVYLVFGLHLFSADQFLERVNVVSSSWAKGGAMQVVPQFSSLLEFIKFEPWFMFTSLFRPLPGELAGALGLAAGLESLFLLAACSASLVTNHDRVAFFCLSSIVIWAAVVGIVSYQNLGTAVRFKLQILPFILLMVANSGVGKWLNSQQLR